MKTSLLGLAVVVAIALPTSASVSLPTNSSEQELVIHPKHLPPAVHGYLSNHFSGLVIEKALKVIQQDGTVYYVVVIHVSDESLKLRFTDHGIPIPE